MLVESSMQVWGSSSSRPSSKTVRWRVTKISSGYNSSKGGRRSRNGNDIGSRIDISDGCGGCSGSVSGHQTTHVLDPYRARCMCGPGTGTASKLVAFAVMLACVYVGRAGWIDPDTPKEHWVTRSPHDGSEYELVSPCCLWIKSVVFRFPEGANPFRNDKRGSYIIFVRDTFGHTYVQCGRNGHGNSNGHPKSD